MAEDFRCNIVTLGKTGAGKSSLLNYLFGTTFKSGVGKPVTGADLYEKDGEINGQKIRVYDSWGIEADKVNEWKALLYKKAAEHGAEKDPSEWFHAVIYCIQAGGGRIENIDTQIISDFVKQGYRVVVALTKIDQIGEDDEVTMKKTINEEVSKASGKQDRIKIISVCAEKKKTRVGETVPQGRRELIEAIMRGWIDALKARLPSCIVALLEKRLNNYQTELSAYVERQKISGRPEDNYALVEDCRRKIDERMILLLEEDIIDVTNILIERFTEIGGSLLNVFNVAETESRDHWMFDVFLGKYIRTQRKRTVAYFASLGIYKLYLSKSKKHINEQKNEIIRAIGYDIDEQKNWLRCNLIPPLEENMEKNMENLIGENDA